MSLGLTPALPLPAIASAGSTAASGASLKASHMYFMGWYTARMNETCSTDLLVSELNVQPDVAREIFGKLVREKAVHPPNALGISQTVDPFSNSIGRISQSSVAPKVSRAAERARLPDFESADFLEEESEELSVHDGETPLHPIETEEQESRASE